MTDAAMTDAAMTDAAMTDAAMTDAAIALRRAYFLAEGARGPRREGRYVTATGAVGRRQMRRCRS